jgi:hypothetical protein
MCVVGWSVVLSGLWNGDVGHGLVLDVDWLRVPWWEVWGVGWWVVLVVCLKGCLEYPVVVWVLVGCWIDVCGFPLPLWVGSTCGHLVAGVECRCPGVDGLC